jgi:putative MATE family efflux protein
MSLRSKLIGDKKFYRMLFVVLLPIAVQNTITNFVSLLDNIMVGQIGTEPMSGVSIANQLFYIFNITIFGAISGAGIFGAQYAGSGNSQGVRETLRYKLMLGTILMLVAVGIFYFCDESLISLYLSEDGKGDLALTLQYGKAYMRKMLWGLPAFVVSQSYASTLRETGETMLPMKGGILAVVVNMLLNYILIFGKLGITPMGVEGAALATVISRYVETGFVMANVHRKKHGYAFVEGLYRHFRISKEALVRISVKTAPLLANEFLWSSGLSFLLQCYSTRGLTVVAALNISNTVNDLFLVVAMSLGSAISILVGQMLGAEQKEKARDSVPKLLFFSVALCVLVGLLLAAAAPFIPRMYNTSEEIRELATYFLWACAVNMPVKAFLNGSYFVLRAGGNTIVTFLFDSAFLWCVDIPLAYCLSRYTALPILTLYLLVQLMDLVKSGWGYYMVKRGAWVRNIVS